MGIRHISAFMKSAFMVMALSSLAWFPFFVFYTVGWEREIHRENPNGNELEVALYHGKGYKKELLGSHSTQ
jgi:hypothetical protein